MTDSRPRPFRRAPGRTVGAMDTDTTTPDITSGVADARHIPLAVLARDTVDSLRSLANVLPAPVGGSVPVASFTSSI